MSVENTIKETLANWQVDYLALHAFLQQEHASLQKRNFEALEIITKNKNECLKKISLHKLPESLNILPTAALESLRQLCTNNPKLAEYWEKTMAIVQDCNHQNEVNGEIIKLLNHSTKRIFNLFKGFEPDNNIYNATGSCSRLNASRASVSA